MNNLVTILVADDEEDIRDILEYNLIKEGYTVVTAVDGEDALEKAKKTHPTLLILDVMMPKMSGVDVCAELREIPDFKNTIITFLTARDDDFSQITCYEAGGDDFMSKPIKPKVLVTRIKALLKRAFRNEEESSDLVVGQFVINKDQYTVTKNNEPVSLVKKEFELFHLLASKPGKVFSREEIFNRIWDVDVIVGDRTIDVHIRKLREKIGEDVIATIKGVGYKFVIA